jgi:hypothetical protein
MRKIKSSEMMTLFDIRCHGRNLTGEIPEKLTQCILGWINYFKKADIKGLLVATDEWMRRRIRMVYWKECLLSFVLIKMVLNYQIVLYQLFKSIARIECITYFVQGHNR